MGQRPPFKMFRKYCHLFLLEREAMEAGSVLGRRTVLWAPDFLSCTNTRRLSAEEQSFVDNELESLLYIAITRLLSMTDLPKEVWEYLRKNASLLIISKNMADVNFQRLLIQPLLPK